MSRDVHIAFVAVYLTILLTVSGFGLVRFLATLPGWNLHWPAVPNIDAGNHGPIANFSAGAHRASYPPIAVRLGQEGDVLVRLTVLPDGSVGNAKIVKSSGSPQLDASALVGVGYWRYRPAMRNGKPVAADVTVKIAIRLRN
jgi:TonB family protein